MSLRKLINLKWKEAQEARAQIRSELELVKKREKEELDSKRKDYIRARQIDDEYGKYARKNRKQNKASEYTEEEVEALQILND